jgi:hypothetical protein
MTMTLRLRNAARRLRLGALAYHAYYAPAGMVKRVRREGAMNLLLSRYGRRQMERAAFRLPAMRSSDTEPLREVHFLTGRRFWYQTCFCAYSLLCHSPLGLRPVIYDDGTLLPEHRVEIRRIFPQARIVLPAEIQVRLDHALPAARYPCLRKRRLAYPHLRKLTDIHAGGTGWKLVLDSDMLFFRAPAFLLAWLQAPAAPCHMLDAASAYGYSQELMAELTQAPLPERLNVGICGLHSEEIEWDRLECWCRALLDREGSHYLQEQALTAMLVADRACAIAPADDYVIQPSREEVQRPCGVMHHYVAESKAWYFRYAWRQVRKLAPPTTSLGNGVEATTKTIETPERTRGAPTGRNVMR